METMNNESYDTDVGFDKWDYVQANRGPQQLPLVMAVPLTVVNVLIFVSGLLGNIAVCIVIIKHRSLHTATNYYLFNLAVSDLTLLVFGLPNDVSIYWHQYPWSLGDSFCKLRALLSEMASYVSVMTIVAFSTERYLAICHPLYLHTMSGLQRAIRIIICLWVVAFCGAFPFSMYTTVDYVFYPVSSNGSNDSIAMPIMESAFCGMTRQPAGVPLAELSTIIFFIIPMLIIAVQYTKMALEISKTTRRTLGNGLKGSVHRDSRRGHSNRSVIRMLSAVVIAFFLCWAPFHAQRLLIIYSDENDEHFNEVNTWMFVVTGIFYYFSSTLNPILYNIMSDRMRSAFKEVLCGYQQSNRNLSRTSTIRETYSRAYHVRVQASKTQIETILDDNEDEKTLMGHEQEQCKNVNSLIYLIEYKDNNLTSCKNETPI